MLNTVCFDPGQRSLFLAPVSSANCLQGIGPPSWISKHGEPNESKRAAFPSTHPPHLSLLYLTPTLSGRFSTPPSLLLIIIQDGGKAFRKQTSERSFAHKLRLHANPPAKLSIMLQKFILILD